MDRRLTERQRAVLDFIGHYTEENSVPPSLQEIGQALGGISPTAALAHVVALEKKGYLRRNPHEARSLELVRSEVAIERPDVYRLPVVGTIAAGQPIEAFEEHNEFLWVEASLARSATNFVLRVQGHSMIGDGIHDGDYVVIQAQNTADNGDTVVALLGGNGVTLKRFYREKGHVRLQPANPFLEPLVVSDVTIQGKVVAVIRRYA
ncbi:MAG TPA: transcriptional repressor LexA [Chloroflexota bacterium]|nr:transcriptional repressor LexA [Chloroflexota bacterium]